MTALIEARAYGPDSTPEEIAALRARLFHYAPGIIRWNEVPVMSIFQLDLFEARLNELTRDLDSFKVLIDATTTQTPGAEVRAKLKKIFNSQPRLKRAALFTGKNMVANVAATIIVRHFGLKSFSLHTTIEEALAALSNAA